VALKTFLSQSYTSANFTRTSQWFAQTVLSVLASCHVFRLGTVARHLLHVELHWLDVPQRIQFKLGVTVRWCLQSNAAQYLVDCCKSTTDVASRQLLRSASRHQLIVPRHHRTKFGRRVFCCRPDSLELAARLSLWSVAAPSPEARRECPDIISSFAPPRNKSWRHHCIFILLPCRVLGYFWATNEEYKLGDFGLYFSRVVGAITSEKSGNADWGLMSTFHHAGSPVHVHLCACVWNSAI